MTRETTPDLFEPSLSEEDDLDPDVHPWSPKSIVYNCFFGGILSGGILFALNERRMGREKAVLPSMLVALVLGLGVFTAVVLCVIRFEGLDNTQARFAFRGASALLGLIWAQRQKRRFETFIRNGGDAAGLWLPGFLAILVALAILIGWMFLLYVAFDIPLDSLSSNRTYGR